MSFEKYLAEIDRGKNEARETVKAMLAVKPQADYWRGMIAVPPGSSLERVLVAFKRKTDIPLELPFFVMLHFVSGMLLAKQVKLKGRLGEFYPELWTIILADSGSGKTLSHDIIAKASPVKSQFPEPASGAKFIQSFLKHNFGLWFQDEIAQKMKQIDTIGTPLSDCKDYLLRAYSNSKIERATKAETITIEKPCLGILGLNTQKSFFDSISEESLLDGFMQRFGIIVAEPDPERNAFVNPEKYAFYDIDSLHKTVKSAFDNIAKTRIHQVYRVGDDAEEAFRASFSSLIREEFPLSYFRRVMFKSFRYALLYHIILGKEKDVIDAEDIGWGARVSALHLQDLKHLISKGSNFSTLQALVEKARKVKARIEANGEVPTARLISQGIKLKGKTLDIKSATTLMGLI